LDRKTLLAKVSIKTRIPEMFLKKIEDRCGPLELSETGFLAD